MKEDKKNNKGSELENKTFFAIVLTTMFIMLMSGCVSQKKYDMALDDIAKLKVKNDFQGYDKADLKYEKNEVISGQNKELNKKSIQLDSLRKKLNVQRKELSELRTIIEALSSGEGNGIRGVEQVEGKVLIPLNDEILFPTGLSDLSERGKESIKSISKMILSLDYDVELWVIGHTDNQPYENADQNNNWKLSLERSLVVTTALIQSGIPESMLTAAGRSKYEPQVTNKTTNGKTQNRRTEIVIIPKKSFMDSIYSLK